MHMPISRARVVPRLLRRRDTRVAVLTVAIVASVTTLVASATDGEHVGESALITVAPTTSGKAHPKVAPASAVPFTPVDTSTTTTLAVTAPAEAAVAPSTSAAPAVRAARQAPPTTEPPAAALEVAAPPPPPPTTTTPPPPPVTVATKKCAVRLHGKGGGGAGTVTSGDVTYLSPAGNAAGWGGRQWIYFPDRAYQDAVAIVTAAVDAEGCTRVTVGGFSNGAAFAAKLYCRGESLGGRLAGVVVDDPVVDHAVTGCAPAAGVAVTLYWTGALAGQSYAGWNCADGDWTCDGGSTIGIDAYAAALGAAVKPSPNSGHAPYANPPELLRF